MKPGIYYWTAINRTGMYRHDTRAQAEKARRRIVASFARANLFPKVEILKCDTNGKPTIWEAVA
jgi:hypothetical protein